MNSTHAAHAPALTVPEAAMLPALQRAVQPGVPRNLRVKDGRTYIPVEQGAKTVERPRRPCRAALHHLITAQRAAWRR